MKNNQSLHAVYFLVVISLVISIMVSMIGVYVAAQNIPICNMDDPFVMWLSASVFIFILVLQGVVSTLRKKKI